MAQTYDAIASYTVTGSAASAITFTSIPQTYTDLRIVLTGADTSGYLVLKLNNSGSSLYSRTNCSGNGTSAYSGRASGDSFWFPDLSTSTSTSGTSTIDIMSYSSTNVYKTALERFNNTSAGIGVWMWSSPSAISSLYFTGSGGPTIQVGTTITIYGIKAA
jgi:hypothetical protein